MKRLAALALALTALCALQLAWPAAWAQKNDQIPGGPGVGDQDPTPPPIIGDTEDITSGPLPDPEDTGTGELRFFTRRYLQVTNTTSDKITVFVQYRTQVDNAWVWQPALPAEGQALAFEIEPNATVKLDVKDRFLAASRVRIWGQGPTNNWEEFKDKDLWLVEEKVEKEHKYEATSMQTFEFKFLSPPIPVIGGAEVPDPIQPPIPEPQPFVIIPSPPPDNIILPPQPIIDPNFPIIREADLQVQNLSVNPGGTFFGVIRNGGPSRYMGGRRWYLLQSNGVGGPLDVVLQGDIPPLWVNRSYYIQGKLPILAQGSRVVLALSPGDDFRPNDFSSVLFEAPSRADLAVTSLRLDGTLLRGTITNNGPANYAGGRFFTLRDGLGLTPALKGPVPALASGQSTEVQLDVTASLSAINSFSLHISVGDDNPFNDTKVRNFNPKNGQPDLAAVDVQLDGNVLRGKIQNNGPDGYIGGRLYRLGFVSKLGLINAGPFTKVPAIPAGQIVEVNFTPLAIPKVDGRWFLELSAGDSIRQNDSTIRPHTPSAADAPDLSVSNLALSKQGVLTGKITNNGTVAYNGARKYFIGDNNKTVKWKLEPVPPLQPGQSTDVALDLGSQPAAQLTFVLQLTAGDKLPTNDTVSLVFNPPAGNGDLGIVSFKLLGDNKTVEGIIKNLSATEKSAVRSYRLSSMAFGVTTAKLPVLDPGKTHKVTFVMASPPTAKFVFQLIIDGKDANPANDTATFTFEPKAAPTPLLSVVEFTFVPGLKKFQIGVKNSGDGDQEAGSTFSLTGPKSATNSKLAAIKAGQTLTFYRDLDPLPPVKVEYKFTLTGKNVDAANASKSFTYSPAEIPDLGITDWRVLPGNKTLSGTIKNFSTTTASEPVPFVISHPGDPNAKSGTVPALKPQATHVITWDISPVPQQATPFTLKISPKDNFPSNDSLVLKFVPTRKAELAASDISVDFKTLKVTGTIKNKSLVSYAATEGRKYELSVGSTVIGSGTIPAISGNASASVQGTLAAMPKGMFNITLKLTSGDTKSSDDTLTKAFTPPLAAKIDLQVVSLLVDSQKITVNLANLSMTEDYVAGGTYTVTGPNNFKVDGAIPKVSKNAKAVATSIVATPAAGTYTVTLNIDDGNKANNQATFEYKPAKTGAAKLVIVSLSRDGKSLKAIIKNDGDADSQASGNAAFFKHTPPGAKMSKIIGANQTIGKLTPGQSQEFTVADPGAGVVEVWIAGPGVVNGPLSKSIK